MRAGRLALFVALITSAGIAQGTPEEQEILRLMEGTIYTVAHRETVDGVLGACGLEFSVIGRDNATRQGGPVTAIGSFYFRKFGSQVAYALKLGVRDVIGMTSSPPFAPANAFVRAPRGAAPPKPIRSESDTPGFALFLGSIDDSVAATYKALLEERRFVVGFNRKPGQQDVNLEVDLSVKDAKMVGAEVVRTRSRYMVDDFNACVGDLFKAAGR